MFRKVFAKGTCKLTAITASVAGVKPWAQVSIMNLLSLEKSDLKVETQAAIDLANRSTKRIRRLIHKLEITDEGETTKVKPKKTKKRVLIRNEISS
jgi:hypothetical protein